MKFYSTDRSGRRRSRPSLAERITHNNMRARPEHADTLKGQIQSISLESPQYALLERAHQLAKQARDVAGRTKAAYRSMAAMNPTPAYRKAVGRDAHSMRHYGVF